jgi:hypothetical protein
LREEGRLPRWLKVANPLIVALQRRGMVIGTVRLLSIPGRKSGKLRSTPVSPLTVDGKSYLVAGFDEADWVKNARAAGWGILAHGVQFFRQLYGVPHDPEAFAALAPRCPVFRIGGGAMV